MTNRATRPYLIGVGLAAVLTLSACLPAAQAGTARTSGASLPTTQAPEIRLAAAQMQTQPGSGNPAGISVSGEGRAMARPDIAHVSVGVQTQAQTAQQAQAENTQQMQAVIDRVKALGIQDRDIRTSGISLHPIHGREQNQITGYQAMNSVRVTVRDVNQSGQILDTAVTAGANLAGNITFGILDDKQLRQQALQAAVQDARTKADALAQPLGLRVTSIISVAEESFGGPRPMEDMARPAMAQAAPVPVEPGELTVQANVRVIFGFGQ
jgi:uncharacterized protein